MEEGRQLLAEINEARAHPQDCCEDIKQQLARFESNTVMRTRKGDKLRVMQGKVAWQDAVLYLERAKPKAALTWSPELAETTQAFLSIRSTSDPNPFKLLKSRFNYEASISFNVNESEVNQTLRELVIAMIVGDGDEKKGNRTTLFHPTYTHFGGVVSKDKGMYVPMFFSETGKFQKKEGGGFGVGGEAVSNKGNKTVYTDRGKELIAELNRIRKDPKSIIVQLKSDVDKFKEDKTLVKDNVVIKTKQGKAGYQDLIAQLQQQYPIPLLKVSQGLCVASADQVVQLQHNEQNQQSGGGPTTSYLSLLKKYCTSSDGINNIIMNRSEDDPYINMLILLLVGDGDKKRSARRKLLSPVLKIIGASVGESYFVINVGESARDNKEAIEHAAMKSMVKEHPKEQKELPKETHKVGYGSPHKQQGERIIKKKTTKSSTLVRGGNHYKQTVTKILYADGEIDEIEEEELLDS